MPQPPLHVWPSTAWLQHLQVCDKPRACTHPFNPPGWWLLMAKRGVPFHPDRDQAFTMALQRIAGYRGRNLSPEGGDLVRAITVDSLVVAPQPVTSGWVHTTLMAVAGLVRWAGLTGEPLDREHLFSPHTRTRFLNLGCTDITDTSRRNYRCRLDLIAMCLAGTSIVPTNTKVLRDGEPVEPHTGVEVATLWVWANGLRPATRRDRMVATLILGLGCGLRSAELVAITNQHVTADTDGVHVTVTNGHGETRVVTCLREWETRLSDLVANTPTGRPLSSPWAEQPTGARNLQNATASAQHTHTPPVWFSPRSLRNTWVVAHLTAGTPLPTLLEAAGVDSIEAFKPFLRFVPQTTPSGRALMLRGGELA